jgi:CDP-glucose 4,6-dehydratase
VEQRHGAVEGLELMSGAAKPAFSWAGRRVLLTGHTGFKGSWMALWLHRLGAQVSGLALPPPSEPSLFKGARVDEVLSHHEADVRDLAAVQAVMKAEQPELVIHMAAQSLVRPSYDDPVGTYATNVMGTVNLLEAARHQPTVRGVLVITTDKCYDNREWPWGYRENDPMGGRDPYSSSKGCAELVCSAYRASFLAGQGVGLATARAGNVIGGGDWARDRLVPDVLAAFSRGEPVALRHPHAVRPWQHVLEPLRGYLTLSERLLGAESEAAQAWNFGPRDDDARSVGEVVAELARRWGDDARTDVQAGDHPHEATWLKLDTSLARQRLSWRPRLDLGGALQLTVDWHRGWLAGADPRTLTLEQIASYEALG